MCVVGGLTSAGILLLPFLYHTGGLPSRDLYRQIHELVANPNRQIASIFEESHIATIFHEDIPADKCFFECLKIVIFKQSWSLPLDPLKQLVLIPLFYLLDCGLCLAGLFGVMFLKGVHGG